MPSSHYFQLNEIVDLISLADPVKLLDIGVGFGKYGFLAREYLELWKDGGDYQKWNRQIDGIEAFEPYITPVHQFIYNNIFIGNALLGNKQLMRNLKRPNATVILDLKIDNVTPF